MTATEPTRTSLQRWLVKPWFLALWCVVAAFGTYACMYGFRKPFTAAGFTGSRFGSSLKEWLVTAQVLGYALSKFVGIKVISEMPPQRRAGALLLLMAVAQLALVFFAFTPAPWNTVWLFVNGMPLGLVFGLVLGFVEGRRMTEIFIAGLCVSFILADGVAKSVGATLLQHGVGEAWMPATAGLLFALPLLVFTWMLHQIPAPDPADVAARSARAPMTKAERAAFLRQHGVRLFGIVLAYLLVTIMRSMRADFAPEIWSGLGLSGQPSIFTVSEMWVSIGVATIAGALVLVKNNRRAFFTSLGLFAAGLATASLASLLQHRGMLGPLAFMVMLGVGIYVPYVVVHTTVFERLIALTHERGNLGFLMYLADSAGYVGYGGVMLARSIFPADESFLSFFLHSILWIASGGLLATALSWVMYARRLPEA